MLKKIVKHFLFCLLAVCMLTGCKDNKADEADKQDKSNKQEASVDSDVQQDDEQDEDKPDYSNISMFGELSELMGKVVDTKDEEFQNFTSMVSAKCLLNSENRVVSVMTADPAAYVNGMTLMYSLDNAIHNLLLDQWSYKAEYIWYSSPADGTDGEIVCYQSAVFEKENLEYVITMNTEENYGEICALELIDKDMYEEKLDNEADTVFAHLHGLQ